jgi:uncharacterized protein (TIGR02271 family)
VGGNLSPTSKEEGRVASTTRNTTEEVRALGEQRNDRFMELEERYAGYEVYDRDGVKIGKVDDLFVDESDNPEYIGVKLGFLGMQSTLIPWAIARVDERARRIEIPVDKATAKEGPSFDDDEEITPEYEERVRRHYGLEGSPGAETRGAYGTYSERGTAGQERSDTAMTGGTDRGRGSYAEEERRGTERGRPGGERPGVRPDGAGTGGADGGREEYYRERSASPGYEGAGGRGGALEGEDEVRVQRAEEELRAETREREAGSVRVRKRVRTEREQVRVPKRREEVHVERVPVEVREASEAEIGEDEIFVPVTEEEVVVEKRPVVKEEIRVRKDVTRDEEIVEEDVRKEEVDIDDQTDLRGRRAAGTGDETRRRNG